jgi:dGTPase
VFAEVRKAHPNIEEGRLTHEAVRRLINRMCTDLLSATLEQIHASGIRKADSVRVLGKPVVMFSPDMQDVNRRLKAFLMERMYRHYKVNRMSSKARRVVKDLFAFFLAEPECLPTDWRKLTEGQSIQAAAEVVCDFIAGMTDRFALDEHARIFNAVAR